MCVTHSPPLKPYNKKAVLLAAAAFKKVENHFLKKKKKFRSMFDAFRNTMKALCGCCFLGLPLVGTDFSAKKKKEIKEKKKTRILAFHERTTNLVKAACFLSGEQESANLYLIHPNCDTMSNVLCGA